MIKLFIILTVISMVLRLVLYKVFPSYKEKHIKEQREEGELLSRLGTKDKIKYLVYQQLNGGTVAVGIIILIIFLLLSYRSASDGVIEITSALFIATVLAQVIFIKIKKKNTEHLYLKSIGRSAVLLIAGISIYADLM